MLLATLAYLFAVLILGILLGIAFTLWGMRKALEILDREYHICS